MAKLKTLLLLVLAGFILVACGSEEKKTAEVVDPRADDKVVLKGYLKQEAPAGFDGDLDKTLECVVNTYDDMLNDDNWEILMSATRGADAPENLPEEISDAFNAVVEKCDLI